MPPARGVRPDQVSAWGLTGGADGAPGSVEIHHARGGREILTKGETLIEVGDRVFVRSGGGGFGDARERASNLVIEDVCLGFVSPEAAKRQYGVEVPDCASSEI